jgi:hypothetical protein
MNVACHRPACIIWLVRPHLSWLDCTWTYQYSALMSPKPGISTSIFLIDRPKFPYSSTTLSSEIFLALNLERGDRLVTGFTISESFLKRTEPLKEMSLRQSRKPDWLLTLQVPKANWCQFAGRPDRDSDAVNLKPIKPKRTSSKTTRVV